jgi:hypothetical protein
MGCLVHYFAFTFALWWATSAPVPALSTAELLNREQAMTAGVAAPPSQPGRLEWVRSALSRIVLLVINVSGMRCWKARTFWAL